MKLTKKNVAVSVLLIAFLVLGCFSVGFCQDAKGAEPAKKLSPQEQAASLVARAIALLEKGEANQAAGLLDKAKSLDPKNEDAWIMLCDIYMMRDKMDYAIANYKKATAALPDSPKVWFNYGIAWGKAGRPEYALKCFDNVIKNNPESGEAWRYKGYTLLKMYNYDEAGPCFEKALALDSSDHRAKLFLGIVKVVLGDRNGGQQIIQQALSGKPELKNEIPRDLAELMGI